MRPKTVCTPSKLSWLLLPADNQGIIRLRLNMTVGLFDSHILSLKVNNLFEVTAYLPERRKMPIAGIEQPEIIQIDEKLRLRKFDDNFEFAFIWYQDEQTNYMMDGKRGVYDWDQLSRMYHYLQNKGEVYFIEVTENETYVPIGDVTFWQGDMPIVIGKKEYRGRGIGKKVISALVERGKNLGFDYVGVGEIYDWNEQSRRCFESVGFRAYEKTEKGSRYRLTFNTLKSL